MNVDGTLLISDLKIQELVDHLNHPIALSLRQCLLREQRISTHEMIIDDIENIIEALQAGIHLKQLFVSGECLRIPELLIRQLPPTCLIYAIKPRTCKKIFGKEKMSRIFAIAQMPSTSILASTPLSPGTDLIVLDGVHISGNIGAIIRTATALNAGGIVLMNSEAVDIYDRRIIRASRGYIFRIPLMTANVEELLAFCRTQEMRLLLMSSEANHTIQEVAHDQNRFAIILGGEKRGCSSLLAQHVELSAKISLNPIVESLNVSVAAAIILYARQVR